PLLLITDGPHQADGEEVHRRQGAEEAAGDEGGAQVGPGHRRREEAPPLPPRHRRAPGDPQVPEEHRAADPQAAVPAPGAGDRAGLQDRPPLPELRRRRAAGGGRGLPRRALRGHQPLRHPRQARHHHAQGHPARPPHPWREGLGVICSRGCDTLVVLVVVPVSSLHM
ncbi:Os01g0866200, partial [Oryza sativa Japonica Group]